MQRLLVLGLSAVSLAACAVPVEDRTRLIDVSWDLEPQNPARTTTTVEMGEIILTWDASARASQELDGSTGPLGLVSAGTSFGTVYCREMICYEDRDADGLFDTSWTLGLTTQTPRVPIRVFNPETLESPIPFRAASDTEAVVFGGTLGLVYNGPMEGRPDENLDGFVSMIGELSIGWYDMEEGAPQPDGTGWNPERVFPILLAEEFTGETMLKTLSLSYRAIKATLSGFIEIEYEAGTALDVDFTEEFDYDIDAPEPDPETNV